METILLEYTLKPDVSIDEVEARIARFVNGMRELGMGVRYTSHRKRGSERSYAHVGVFPNAEAEKAVTTAPFFKEFTAYLPERCSEKPRVTRLDVVASTDG